MLQQFLEEEKESLLYFFKHLDVKPLETLSERITSSKNLIFVTGVGKSAHTAKKIAETLISIGIRAHFFSPVDAMHGELGIVQENDLVLMFSKSGESDELIHLLPFLKNKKAYLVSVTSTEKNRLSENVNLSIFLPLLKELCPFDLAPTTSSTTQMIFGDLLTRSIMEKRKLSLEEYAKNHPAGRIGRRITLRVEDLMVKGDALPKVSPKQKVKEILHELSHKKSGCVLVSSDKDELLGIFTDGDLRRALETYEAKSLEMRVEEVMTKHPKQIQKEILVVDALEFMEKDPLHPIAMLPVTSSPHKIEGLLRLHDILQCGI